MNGKLNKNQLTVVKEYEYLKPPFQKIDSINDNCFIDCHKGYFHMFLFRCIVNIYFTNFRNNKIIKLPFSDESLGLYELKKS